MSEPIEVITIFVLPLTIVTFLLYIFAKAMEVDGNALAKAFVVALASNLIYFFVAVASEDPFGLILVFISWIFFIIIIKFVFDTTWMKTIILWMIFIAISYFSICLGWVLGSLLTWVLLNRF